MTLSGTWLAVSASKSTIVLARASGEVVVGPPRGRCEYRVQIQLGSGQEMNLDDIWIAISYEPGAP